MIPAFIDSPIQLIVLFAVLLIVLGPQRMPEVGLQIGKALRELKRMTQEITSQIDLDDKPHDKPTVYGNGGTYDSYGNPYEGTPEPKSLAPAPVEPPHGDFSAPALADSAADYGAVSGEEAPPHVAAATSALPASPTTPLAPPHAEAATPQTYVSDLVKPAVGAIPRRD